MKRICLFSLAIAALIPLLAVTAPADTAASDAVLRYLVTRDAAFASLLSLHPDSLQVPSPPPPGAVVRVRNYRWDALRNQFEFHLECSPVRSCRPFLATLRCADGGDLSPADASNLLPDRGGLRAPGSGGAAPPLVRAGEHVRLLVTGPGVRMKIPAVTLERGVLGQTIRVRSVEDPKVFHAQVIGKGWLQTAF